MGVVEEKKEIQGARRADSIENSAAHQSIRCGKKTPGQRPPRRARATQQTLEYYSRRSAIPEGVPMAQRATLRHENQCLPP